MANKNNLRALMSYSTIGLQLAITLLIFLYIGYRLDKHYNTGPLFVVVGTAIGMLTGFYHLITGLKRIENNSKNGNSRDSGNKWL